MSIVVQTGNVEKLVCIQGISLHRDSNTESKVYLLTAMDNKEVTCLTLQDLNAAFDTVNHKLYPTDRNIGLALMVQFFIG